jgi:hypothetical protein
VYLFYAISALLQLLTVPRLINVSSSVPLFTDEGVYVNNSGSLVKHAVMQWGETPYAVGKLVVVL